MKVLVCGGRNYRAWWKVFDCLDRLHELHGVRVVIHGAATGADSFAGYWARYMNIVEQPYPILAGEGGYSRNGRMLIVGKPDLVVYFPGGNGTRDMVDIARAAGIDRLGGLKKI